MKNLITNFDVFINEKYLYEDKSPLMVPTMETIKEIMERQKKYSYGKRDPESSLKGKILIEWKQRQESLDIFESIPEEEKNKILEAVKKEFELKKITDKKYNAFMDQESDRLSKNDMYKRPFIIVTKEDIVKIEPSDEKPGEEDEPTELPTEFKGTVDLIPSEVEGSVFKDNKWENKPESYTDSNVVEQLKNSFDALQDLIQIDLKSGGMFIKDIKILASASRLRNTGTEKLSWLELGKKRSETLAMAVGQRVKLIEGIKEKDSELIRNKISLDYFGSNGDGTSGPDPLSPYKRGYYTPDGTFKDEQASKLKGKKTLDILVVEYDDSGKPKGEPKLLKAKDLDGKEMTEELKNNITDYKQFQYNQITVTFNESYKPGGEDKEETEGDKKPQVATEPKIEETKSVKFSIGLKSAPWSQPPGPSIPPPNFKKIRNKIRKGWKKIFGRSKKKNYRSLGCPKW